MFPQIGGDSKRTVSGRDELPLGPLGPLPASPLKRQEASGSVRKIL